MESQKSLVSFFVMWVDALQFVDLFCDWVADELREG